MRQQSPRLSVSTDSGVTVVELSDKKILDEVSIAQIADQLAAIVAQSATPRIVLDFTRVQHMSSGAWGC